MVQPDFDPAVSSIGNSVKCRYNVATRPFQVGGDLHISLAEVGQHCLGAQFGGALSQV